MRGFVPAWKPGQSTRPMAVVSDSKSAELKALAKDVRMIVDVELNRLALPMAVEQPFEVLLCYYMPRAGGDFFKGTSNVRPQARATPWTKPDLDKLERATLDALTGLAWDDDSRVVRVVKEKRFATPKRDIGIWCELRVLPATVREAHEWSQLQLTKG